MKVLIIVPKKNIPLASKRNAIKRVLRETFRVNSYIVQQKLKEKKISLNIAIIYSAKEITSFNVIEGKMKLVLNRLKTLNELAD